MEEYPMSEAMSTVSVSEDASARPAPTGIVARYPRQLRLSVTQARELDDAARRRGIMLMPGRSIIVVAQLHPLLKIVPKKDQILESSPPVSMQAPGNLFWNFTALVQCYPEHTDLALSVVDKSGMRSKVLASTVIPLSAADHQGHATGWFDLSAPQKTISSRRPSFHRHDTPSTSQGHGQLLVQLELADLSSRQPTTAHSYVAGAPADDDAPPSRSLSPSSTGPPAPPEVDMDAPVDEPSSGVAAASAGAAAEQGGGGARSMSGAGSAVVALPAGRTSVASDGPPGGEEGPGKVNPVKEMRAGRTKAAASVAKTVDWLNTKRVTRAVVQMLPAELTVATGRLGHVVVTVVEARDLPDVKTMFRRGAVNPFCVVQTGTHWWRTVACVKTSDPVWNTAFEFEVIDLSHEVRFLVYEGRDEFLGQASVSVASLAPLSQRDAEVWLPLRVRNEPYAADALSPASLQGYLHVRLRWHCEDLLAAALNFAALLENETGASEVYSGNREQTMRKLDRAGIPPASWDKVFQSGKRVKVDGTLVRNNFYVMEKAIFGPAVSFLTYLNKVRTWDKPVVTTMWMVFYTLLCLYPGAVIRWFPLVAAIFVIQRRQREFNASDDGPPDRLPHAVRRDPGPATTGPLPAEDEWETLSNTSEPARREALPPIASREPGLFDRLRQVKQGVTTMDSALGAYFEMYNRAINAWNWSSPVGTAVLVVVLVLLWAVLMVFGLRAVGLTFGAAFFWVPAGRARDRSSLIGRFLRRVPTVRRTLRVEDRLPAQGST